MNKKLNINVSDVVLELQQIDFSTLFQIINPIIVYYVSSKAYDAYKIHKDFKAKANSKVILPPSIKRVHTQIDKERLLKQQFGNCIINFANTIVEKIPDTNLILFYNNLNSLTTSVKSFKLQNLILKDGTKGEYKPKLNKIQLQENNYETTIDHELFHMASTYYRESDGVIFTGFAQIKGLNIVANAINEGYTQLLTERYFGETKEVLKAYGYEKFIAEKLEMIIGRKKMQSLYFSASLPGLIEELKKYVDEQTIMQFFADVDFVSEYMIKKGNSLFAYKLINSKLKSVDEFLLRCYAKKVKIMKEEKIDINEIRKELGMFVSKIGVKIKYNNRQYDYYSVEEMEHTVSEVLEESESNSPSYR